MRAFLPLLTAALVAASSPLAAQQKTAVLAGACLWGIEAVFEHVKGVTESVSGYAGGIVTFNFDPPAAVARTLALDTQRRRGPDVPLD